MASHPLKINVVTKDGTTFSHFTSSFARDGETLISSSVMVDKINAMPVGDNGTYTWLIR